MSRQALALAVLALALVGVDCADVGVKDSSPDSGYDDGCDDGFGFGYSAGLSSGEACDTFDDDAGERFDSGDPYEAAYNEGYADCYPGGYSQGYDEGSASSGC